MGIKLVPKRRDNSLSAAQRTRLGLGPIETDPRDTLTVADVIERDERTGHVRCLGEIEIAYERAAVRQRDVPELLRPLAKALALAERDRERLAESETRGIIGIEFDVEI